MKASGSWESLLQGVSQQIPEIRLPGQHGEQINMLPDPVRGLTRRPGSVMKGERELAISLDVHLSIGIDSRSWVSFDYTNGGVDYTVCYRRSARAGVGAPGDMVVYDKTNNVFLPYSRNAVDADLTAVQNGGISAMTSIGRYVYFAGNTLLPTQTSVAKWADATNLGRAVLWVRAGAYNRKYGASVTRTDGTVFSFSYTTPSAAYDQLLDTSGVPVFTADPAGGTTTDSEAAFIRLNAGAGRAELMWYAWSPAGLTATNGGAAMTNTYPAAPTTTSEFSWGGSASQRRYVYFTAGLVGDPNVSLTYSHLKTVTNPNYARSINELTNEYNQAVNAHIKAAAAAIEPEAIAEQLRAAAVASGLGGTTTRNGTHVIFTNVKGITLDDGSDDSLIRGVAQEVSAVDKVSPKHYVGKVVQVKAKNAEESYYLRAIATDSTVTSGITDVTWVEGAGTEQVLTGGILVGTVHAGTFAVASTPALLQTLTGLTVPTFVPSQAGDGGSNGQPFFIGNKITYLGVFQDRLLVGSGGVIRASRTGDYLNFYRTTVLTVPADDAIEFLSESSESDELRHGVLYDKSLVLFGQKRQYAIDGRIALTGTSANLPAISTHGEAAEVPPVAAGGLIYYAKNGELYASLHQIQPGQNPESPESYPASAQVDSYMTGKAIEIRYVSKPSMIAMRTTGDRFGLHVFSYVDAQDARKQSAWHRWTFDTSLGMIVGMTTTALGLLVFFLRRVNGVSYYVADLLPLTAQLSTRPYLDSLRTLANVEGGAYSVKTTTTGPYKVAIAGDNIYRFLGDTLANLVPFKAAYAVAEAVMWVGTDNAASVLVTNPFMKDRNNVTITTGELTVQRVVTTWQDSSGYIVTIKSPDETLTQEHNGRVVGDPNNIVGREVVTDFTASFGVGREVRKYEMTLAARTWLPFCLTRMEWVGQFFNRTQRVS